MTMTDDAVDVEALIDADHVALLTDIGEAGSTEWLEARQGGVGGSEAAAILGLGEFESAFELYYRKVGAHPDGLTAAENEAMFWGKVLEDPIAATCARRAGLTFAKPAYLYRSRDWPWMYANPDRIAVDPERPDLGIYEGKTCGVWMADRWSADEPATYALIQAVHYMAVLRLQWAEIAVLIGGQQFHRYRIERDSELIAMLVEYEADFWDHVERRVPPAPSHLSGDTELLNRLWTAVGEKVVLVGDEAIDLCRRYHEAELARKRAENEKVAAANALRLLIGDGAEAKTAEGLTVATWKAQSTTKFDQARFETEMPLAASRYKHQDTIRVLRPKKVGHDNPA